MASHGKHQKLREETFSLFKLVSSIANRIDDNEDDQPTGKEYFLTNELLKKDAVPTKAAVLNKEVSVESYELRYADSSI